MYSKMTEKGYLRMLEEHKLPQDMLKGIFMRIAENEIQLKNEDTIELDHPCFIAPTHSGWLSKRGHSVTSSRTTQQRYFLLKGGMLYYFTKPQQDALRCIIPLKVH
jgi:hypothetical protein